MALPEGVPSSKIEPGFLVLVLFAALLFLMPANLVVAGPLKSNGSPSVLLALLSVGLIVIAAATGHVSSALRGAGVVLVLLATALQLLTWAVGQIDLTNTLVRASTTRALIALVTSTAVAILPMLVAPTARHRHVVRVVLALGMLYSAVAGIVQAQTSGFDLRYLVRPPGFALNGDFVNTDRDGFIRSLGTAGHPIEFSVTCSCLLAVALTLVGRRHSTWVRALGWVAILVAPVALLDSLSRTGAVAFGAVFLVYAFTLPIEATAVGLLGIAAIAAFAYVVEPAKFQGVIDLFLRARSDSSITSRTDDYSYVAARFDQRPWLGYGLGTQVPTQTRYLDNQWLQAALQGGVVGIAATAAQFGAGLIACVSPAKLVDRWERTAYLAVIAAIFISSFTFDLYSFNQARFLLFLTIGLAWSAYREGQQTQARKLAEPAGPATEDPDLVEVAHRGSTDSVASSDAAGPHDVTPRPSAVES